MRPLALFFVFVLFAVPAKPQTPFDLAVDCIKRYEGLHAPEHYPYVGYGHRLLPGEKFETGMGEERADSLLREDLLRRCRIFRSFGRDSLLLGVLAYNVGENRVKGSRLVQRLKAGLRDVGDDYASFRLIGGKVSPALEKRRKEEFRILFIE